MFIPPQLKKHAGKKYLLVWFTCRYLQKRSLSRQSHHNISAHAVTGTKTSCWHGPDNHHICARMAGNNSVRCSFTHCKVNICLNPPVPPLTADWFQTTQTAFWWDDFWETCSESLWDLEPWHMGNTIQCIMGQRWFKDGRGDRSNSHLVMHSIPSLLNSAEISRPARSVLLPPPKALFLSQQD